MFSNNMTFLASVGVTAEVNHAVTGGFLSQILMTDQSNSPKTSLFVSISYTLDLWVTIKWSFHVNSPSNTRSSQQETVHVRRVLIDWKYYVAPRCSVQEVMMSWFLIWYQHNMDFDTLPFHRRRESDEAQTSFARCNVVINNNIKEVLFDCSQSYGS